jgi:hypothetical protein
MCGKTDHFVGTTMGAADENMRQLKQFVLPPGGVLADRAPEGR